MGVAVFGLVASFGGGAGAISGGSISPTTLSANGQQFSISYSGKSVDSPNLIVVECISDDTKPGFDPFFDCSNLSLQNKNNVPTAGTITYGGEASNPTAPFVGIDPENGEWSVCDPNSGVTNYQSGFFRLADSPSDQADDFFIPFTCAGSPPASTTTTAPATTTTTTPVASTTTTTPDATTTTTLGDTTTTTVGDAATTTTTSIAGATTTTVAGGVSGGGAGSGDGSGGFAAGALARTGSNTLTMVKLALLLVYVGFMLRTWGDTRGSNRGRGMA